MLLHLYQTVFGRSLWGGGNMNKVIRSLGILLAVASIGALWLPVHHILTDGEGGEMTIRVYHLADYSPWGIVLVALPFIVLGLMLSNVSSTIKTIGILGIAMLGGIAFWDTVMAMYEATNNLAICFTQAHGGHLAYGALILWSMMCFWVSYNVFFAWLDPQEECSKEEYS